MQMRVFQQVGTVQCGVKAAGGGGGLHSGGSQLEREPAEPEILAPRHRRPVLTCMRVLAKFLFWVGQSAFRRCNVFISFPEYQLIAKVLVFYE